MEPIITLLINLLWASVAFYGLSILRRRFIRLAAIELAQDVLKGDLKVVRDGLERVQKELRAPVQTRRNL